jgi:membrane protein implicated in regulation of membrane protease activity
MKYKTWLMISFYSLLFGWFPFMFLSVWGSWNREVEMFVFSFSVILCVVGTMTMMPLLRDQDLFKSIDELEEERMKYYEARKRLEKKIIEL